MATYSNNRESKAKLVFVLRRRWIADCDVLTVGRVTEICTKEQWMFSIMLLVTAGLQSTVSFTSAENVHCFV